MQELELSLTGILAIFLAFAFLSGPFKFLSLCGTAGIAFGRGVAMLMVGLAGALTILAVKSVKGAKRWKPAPEQSFEPASRSYPATPKKGERQGSTYEGRVDRDQPRLVEAKAEELLKIGSNRPARK